jgi:hypothetical protein
VSTSQIPTPGPPLREREGMMRLWRVGPLGPEVEAVEGPACGEGTAEDCLEGPATEGVVAFIVPDAATAATPAGSAVGADTRLGIQPEQNKRGQKISGGIGKIGERRSSPLSVLWFRPAPLWHSLCVRLSWTMARVSSLLFFQFIFNIVLANYSLRLAKG